MFFFSLLYHVFFPSYLLLSSFFSLFRSFCFYYCLYNHTTYTTLIYTINPERSDKTQIEFLFLFFLFTSVLLLFLFLFSSSVFSYPSFFFQASFLYFYNPFDTKKSQLCKTYIINVLIKNNCINISNKDTFALIKDMIA